MIVPMMRYSILMYDGDAAAFLQYLQELGVVDLVRTDSEPAEGSAEALQNLRRISQAIKLLSAYRSGNTVEMAMERQQGDLVAILEETEALKAEKEMVESDLLRLQKELDEVTPWGNFSPELFDTFNEMGRTVRFYACPIAREAQLLALDLPLFEISRSAKELFFVTVSSGPLSLEGLPITEWKAPRAPYSVILTELAWKQKRMGEVVQRFTELALLVPFLEGEKNRWHDQMDHTDFLHQGRSAAGEKLALFTGYVPVDQVVGFEAFLADHPVLFFTERVSRKEKAPVLLRNGRFARLFEPIAKLYRLPLYQELDLTALFAPFFMMFFGFCLGDAGYGLVLFFGAWLAKRKVKAPWKPIMDLVRVLGVATFFFSLLTGSLFGMKLGTYAPFEGLNRFFLTDTNLFYLALTLGVIQILFGMGVKVANLVYQQGFRAAISSLSWLLFFVSILLFYGLSQVPEWGVSLFGVGHQVVMGLCAVGIFFFNSPGKSLFLNVGTGVWDSYNMATGLLGDVLSYVRLFALNLSGAVLGGVFNSLAFGLSPDIPVVGWLVTLLILLFGHSLNLFMNALGALVHPMRLTFVEFYKNAGFSGGGKMYQPFSKRAR